MCNIPIIHHLVPFPLEGAPSGDWGKKSRVLCFLTAAETTDIKMKHSICTSLVKKRKERRKKRLPSYLCRPTSTVLPCCYKTANRGCGANGSRRNRVTTCCTSWSRGTGSCRAAGGEGASPSGDSAAGSGWRPSTGSSAVSETADQTP
jgi:hypothetical protein